MSDLHKRILETLEEAKGKAQAAWTEFEGSRQELESKAKDSKELPDDDTISAAREKHEAYQKAHEEVDRIRKQLEAVAPMIGTGGPSPATPEADSPRAERQGQAPDWGSEFTSSEGYKRMKGRFGGGSSWSTGAVELKATLTTDAASGGDLILPQVKPGILPLLFKRLTVADLMSSGTTDSNMVSYMKETTFTNAAATVVEGAAKAESTLIFDRVDDLVTKIAHFLPVTDEMLEDVSQIRSYINARLRLGVELTEEDQLLNGNGTPPNMTGLLNRSGKQTDEALGANTRPDAVYNAITKIRNGAFLEPDGFVVHPNDWAQFRLMKDSAGQYFGGGPFTGAYGNGTGMAPDVLWGLRVVITPSIAEGTGLVGAFRASAQVFRKGGISVDASNSHSDFFIKNLTAIRAEERLALAVYRPGGLCKLTGL